ncbi:FAD-dependent monooxygenase (plasmid) [Streptomyces sp. NBC_00868]|uniref:FAD-dependent monooxygenase n=1 Tax=unclassified Streptomyces TaxID=2593676 RepID=UPI002F9077E2|nr:FAD-dependent monooxygenase [Streptomyces sp. NBC_00868]
MRGTEVRESDVCVVGAGPAGLALTLMLLRSGVRTTLVERATAFRRDFHGEILQPGGQRVLDDLGVLAPARRRGSRVLDGFQVVQDERRLLLDIDYRRLPAPYDHLLALPQPFLLGELLDACRALPGFTYLEGHRLASLVEKRPGAPVTGVVTRGPDHAPTEVRARVVVGADGRYSKTRALAGIAAGRSEAFAQDAVWFSLHAPGRTTGRVRVHRAGGSVVLVHESHPDRLRVGWTLPHGSWRDVVARGMTDVRRELTRTLPQFADLLHEQLSSPAQLTLLDVFASHAEDWARDGLVLLGDAAHTHGPVGAQGVNLALQDAAALHPVLVDALNAGQVSRERLAPYQRRRSPVAQAVHRMQRVQTGAVFGAGGGPLADFARTWAAAAVGRTPVGARIARRVAHGTDPLGVRTDLFTVRPAAAKV